MNPELQEMFESLTPHKQSLFKQVADNRTHHITVVLEDIFQPQNASAVLRTCDCLGIQQVHIIENENTYTLNPQVTLGSEKWLDIKRYHRNKENTTECITRLKEAGYRIVSTVPNPQAAPIQEINLSEKTAFLFGSELNGLSEKALSMADSSVYIPMFGFTESFNISVSAGIILHHAVAKMRSENAPWKLNEELRNACIYKWCKEPSKK